jgi:HPt (histidine-containing phosphotransfer) domain-containing protein
MSEPAIDQNVFSVLKDTVGADFIGELIDAFFEDASKMFAELRQSLAAQDSESFRRAAHSLKSTSATFGATKLSELSRELESMGREKNLNIGNRLQVLEETYRGVESQLKVLRLSV